MRGVAGGVWLGSRGGRGDGCEGAGKEGHGLGEVAAEGEGGAMKEKLAVDGFGICEMSTCAILFGGGRRRTYAQDRTARRASCIQNPQQ